MKDKIISLILAVVMLISAPAVLVHADETSADAAGSGGKYVSDVFFAYGEDQDAANQWLIDNGWEPIQGDNDFTAGKNSKWDDAIVTAMGIKRTDDENAAITDMAVMNMKGGYSFPDYESLVEEKKTQIDEFINSFIPVLEEYRSNYNNQGAGKRRADLAFYILNKFTDGGEMEKYPVNDTGEHLGELFLKKTRQEGNEEGADLQQIILESSGPAVLAVEQCLALATDTAETTWLDRLMELSGDELTENIGKYVPEAAGQKLAPSALTNMLQLNFGDAAASLASQWYDINERMLWYERYNNDNDLWQYDDEDDEAYLARIEEFFNNLKAEDEEIFNDEINRYNNYGLLYNALYEMPYEGEWGETLGDLFNPYDGTDYGLQPDVFLPFAAVLSTGQRSGLEFLPLYSLIYIGMSNEGGIDALFPDIQGMLGDALDLSIYSGVNRSIFRGGVALTSEALMRKNRGYDPFGDLWSFSGIYNITCYSAAIATVLFEAAGAAMIYMGRVGDTVMFNGRTVSVIKKISDLEAGIQVYADSIRHTNEILASGNLGTLNEAALISERAQDLSTLQRYENELQELEQVAAKNKSMISTGRILMGVGGAILIAAAFMKGYQMYRYYQRTFTQIPLMIVDEADIVTYTKGADGQDIKNIDFDSYMYYEAAECNRQKIDKISDWQDGVDDYDDWGCGDVADLNGDFGQEWLALYTVKSPKKGDPILADSLKLQYGSDKQPDGTDQCLHFFTFTYAADLGDTAYSYNNKKHGVYLFWDADENAFADSTSTTTASTFTGGHIAIAGAGGLIIGILVSTLVLFPRRKKKEQEDA